MIANFAAAHTQDRGQSSIITQCTTLLFSYGICPKLRTINFSLPRRARIRAHHVDNDAAALVTHREPILKRRCVLHAWPEVRVYGAVPNHALRDIPTVICTCALCMWPLFALHGYRQRGTP
jgi:hypothetical protein